LHRSLLSLLIAPGLLLRAQDPGPSLRAVRAASAPQLDGGLEDAPWALAPVATDFLQSAPNYGQSSRLKTEARVLFDETYLYIGLRMIQEVPVLAPVFRRDAQNVPTDWVSVEIDSLGSRRTALRFQVSASGVRMDALLHSDTLADPGWDGLWEAETRIQAGGWTAELRIPLSLLPMKPGKAWGLNLSRHCAALQETSSFHLPSRDQVAWVSAFPRLEGVEDLQPKPRREWIPYVLGQRKFETAQPYDDRRGKLTAGLDAHLGLGPASQLDLSLRPDFAQVEMDQAVLNLSAIETQLPEKRPFFLEGMDVFVTPGVQLFYSRRLGKALGDPVLNPGEKLEDRPSFVDIAGAAKLTGSLDQGLRYGLLSAVTERAQAEIRLGDGSVERREQAPQTTDLVFRAQQPLGDGTSYVGAFTSLARSAGGQRDARVGALDGSFTSADRSTQILGQASFSRIQTPQDPHREGHALDLRVTRTLGHGYSLFWGSWHLSRDFDPNDLGYVDFAGQKGTYLEGTKNWDRAFGSFTSAKAQLWGQYRTDLEGVPSDRNLGARLDLNLKNQWSLHLEGTEALPIQSDLELRTRQDPVRIYFPRRSRETLLARLSAPGAAAWRPSLEAQRTWQEGGPTDRFSLGQVWRPSPPLQFELTTAYQRARGEDSYFETVGGRPVAGLRSLQQVDVVLRGEYAFSRALTLQAFTQWMDAAWSYRDLRAFNRDGSTQPWQPDRVPAASARLWNLNLIARWEFRPGSTAYLVYTHGVRSAALLSERAALRPGSDLDELRHLPSDDSVQLKVSWMFR